jgi:hypothetical protein
MRVTQAVTNAARDSECQGPTDVCIKQHCIRHSGETFKETKKRKAEEKTQTLAAARQAAMKEAQQRNQEGICQLFKVGKVVCPRSAPR